MHKCFLLMCLQEIVSVNDSIRKYTVYIIFSNIYFVCLVLFGTPVKTDLSLTDLIDMQKKIQKSIVPELCNNFRKEH